MGEKYTPEKLAAMRSVGHLKGGRTKHTDAGTIRKDVKEIRTEDGFVRKTADENNAVITEHLDGSQDVELHPEPIHGKMAIT